METIPSGTQVIEERYLSSGKCTARVVTLRTDSPTRSETKTADIYLTPCGDWPASRRREYILEVCRT